MIAYWMFCERTDITDKLSNFNFQNYDTVCNSSILWYNQGG